MGQRNWQGIGDVIVSIFIVAIVLAPFGYGAWWVYDFNVNMPPAPTPTPTPPCAFEHTVSVVVEGSNVSRVLETFKGVMILEIPGTQDPEHPKPYLKFDSETATAHEAWLGEIADKDQIANEALETVLWQSNFALPPEIVKDSDGYEINTSDCTKGEIAYAESTVMVASTYNSSYGYTTTFRVDGNTAYVTIETPGGSWASMVIPTGIYFDTIQKGWNQQELPSGKVYVGPVDSGSDVQSYQDELYSTVVNAKKSGHEIGSFRYPVAFDDFEGRNQIGLAFAGILRMNAAQYKNEVAVAIFGFMTEDQELSAIARLDANGISALGGFIGPIGLGGASGGGAHGNYSASVTTERMIHGSVYLVPISGSK